MKKVWILEMFETCEMMEHQISNYQDMIANIKDKDVEGKDEAIKEVEKIITKMRNIIAENPNGRWHGFEGKSIYYQFCNVARAAIKRNPDMKFRVVEGEIDDNAQYWLGYRFVKENEGVLRYLMATINKLNSCIKIA